MRNKFLTVFMTVILLFRLCFSGVQVTAEGTAAQFSVTLQADGAFTITCVFPDNANGQTTFLVTDMSALGGNVTSQNIKWIDQTTADANGRAATSGILSGSVQGQDLIFAGGGASGSGYKNIITIPQFPISVGNIPNNSIRIGNDVYDASSVYLDDPANVAASIRAGGNNIYYKVGGLWYDLTDARSSVYFTPANAIQAATVNGWELDTWYPELGVEPIPFPPIDLEYEEAA
jgi:hypothetical protein